MNGIYHALEDSEKTFGISFRLVMCFLRDSPVEHALNCLNEAIELKQTQKYNKLIAVGLDSDEMGYPPSLFQQVIEIALSRDNKVGIFKSTIVWL